MHRLNTLLWISAAVRLLLLLWGEAQDRLLSVKYTDIDYVVFTDAARFVAQGGSPFDRSTYRYSPLLAYLLLPNIWLHGAWGKLLFSAGDVLVAVMIARLLSRMNTPEASILVATAAWLYNPYTLTISTRGSCDVLAVLLLLGMLQLLVARRTALAAVVYGLVVHLRIYPIIFAPTLVFFLATRGLAAKHPNEQRSTGSATEATHAKVQQALQQAQQPLRRQSDAPAAATYTASSEGHTSQVQQPPASLWSYPASAWLHQIVVQGLAFGLMSALVFLALNAIFYRLYGQRFLQEAFLHHVTRKDPRHNFSPHFYPVYLSEYSPKLWPAGSEPSSSSSFQEALAWASATLRPQNNSQAWDPAAEGDHGAASCTTLNSRQQAGAGATAWQLNLSGWATFIQLGLQLILAAALHWDLPGCLLLQTMAFVAFNKVCTAQYFVWFFSLLPLILPRLSWPTPRGLVLAMAFWVVLQLHWLLWGYLLEFQGLPVHLMLWGASIAFLAANACLVVQLIKCLYRDARQYSRDFLTACMT